METKTCTRCKVAKPLTEYYTNGSQGLYPHCKVCKTRSSTKHAPQQRCKPEQKARIKKYNAEYNRTRRAADPGYRVLVNLRNRQKKVMHGLVSTTAELGCDSTFLRSYLEGLWQSGMCWDNYGYGNDKWNIDHKLPLTSFKKTSSGEWDAESTYNKQLLHYTNLQPMWHWENIKKFNKIVA